MSVDWVRQFCLSLPYTTETIQWGSDLVFKIAGKMYAVLALEPGDHWLSFKCTPDDFARLVEQAGIIPAPWRSPQEDVTITPPTLSENSFSWGDATPTFGIKISNQSERKRGACRQSVPRQAARPRIVRTSCRALRSWMPAAICETP